MFRATLRPYLTYHHSFCKLRRQLCDLSTLLLSQEIGPTSIKLEISGPPSQELSLIDHNIILTHLDVDNSSKLDFVEEVVAVVEYRGENSIHNLVLHNFLPKFPG